MGLVEAVTGKGLHLVKNIVGEFVADTAMGGAINKHETLLGHLGRLFLTHGAAQDIGITERVTGQHLGDLHDLFLVKDDAIGGFQD